MTRRRDPRPAKALATMRNLVATGWHEQSLLVDAAAEAIGGDVEARRIAVRVYDDHYALREAI